GSKFALLRTLGPLLTHWRQLDIHAPPRSAPLDTRSIDDYVRNALGQEVLDYLIDPVLNGIFYFTPQHTSQALLFLLIKAAIGLKLYTLRGGLQRLPRAMAADLPILYSAEVQRVAQSSAGGYVVEALVNDQEREFDADGVICAIPAPSIAGMISRLDDVQQAFFDAILY